MLPEESVLAELHSLGVISVPVAAQRGIVEHFITRLRDGKGLTGEGGAELMRIKDLVTLGNLVSRKVADVGPMVAGQMFIEATHREPLTQAELKGKQSALFTLAEMWRIGQLLFCPLEAEMIG